MKTAYAMRISDWSSDVCSSDLLDLPHHEPPVIERRNIDFHNIAIVVALGLDIGVVKGQPHQKAAARAQVDMLERPRRPLGWQPFRSEERRVGKECVRTCRSRWSQYVETTNTKK